MHSQIKSGVIDVKYIIAKTIRVVTIPPAMVLFLLLLIRNFSSYNVFESMRDFYASLIFLAIVPFLAYPLSYVFPKIRQKGRDGQRSLAINFSIAGYACAMVYAVAFSVAQSLMLIYLTYFLSVIVLSVFNKVVKVRASGHACSICGPLVLSVYFIGIRFVVFCIALFALVIWASVYLKRHTPKELLLGALSSAVSFFVSIFFVNIGFYFRAIGFLAFLL